MIDKDLTHKIDKISLVLVLLVTSLRSNITIDENKQAIASIPESLLNRIEAILQNL